MFLTLPSWNRIPVTEKKFSETISAKDLSNWAQNSFISREIVTKHSTFNLIELWRVKDDT